MNSRLKNGQLSEEDMADEGLLKHALMKVDDTKK